MKTLAIFVDHTKCFPQSMEGGSSHQAPKEESLWQQSYLFQRWAWRADQQSSENQRRSSTRWSIHPLSSLFSLMTSVNSCSPMPHGRCMQMSLMTQRYGQKQSKVITAAIRMQEAMNLILDWTKEWSVMINRTKTKATCFSLSPKRGHPVDQWTRNPPARHPITPRSQAGQKTYLVSPHQYNAQQSSQGNGLDGETGTNKTGNQHETTTVSPHIEYAPNVGSSAARTNPDQPEDGNLVFQKKDNLKKNIVKAQKECWNHQLRMYSFSLSLSLSLLAKSSKKARPLFTYKEPLVIPWQMGVIPELWW